MPLTPYHFGVGLLIKSAAPKRISFIAFVASNVIIDFETLYYLLNHEYPIHRTLHTFTGGFFVGIIIGLLIYLFGRIIYRLLADQKDSLLQQPEIKSEFLILSTLIGGVIGGMSHSLLDGIMHRDVFPFLPFSSSQILLRLINLPVLHSACIWSGIIGIVILILRWYVAKVRI